MSDKVCFTGNIGPVPARGNGTGRRFLAQIGIFRVPEARLALFAERL
jgi:hypothetical protein